MAGGICPTRYQIILENCRRLNCVLHRNRQTEGWNKQFKINRYLMYVKNGKMILPRYTQI